MSRGSTPRHAQMAGDLGFAVLIAMKYAQQIISLELNLHKIVFVKYTILIPAPMYEYEGLLFSCNNKVPREVSKPSQKRRHTAIYDYLPSS